MKIRLIALVLLVSSVTTTLSSCYASRSKYGCPATEVGKFRG